MISIWGELKRRNVIRVAVAYAIVSWLILQLTDVLLPLLSLPEWSGRLVFLLLIIGFPLALIFAWAFELTSEGIRLEKNVVRTESVTPFTGRTLDFFIIAALSLALVFVVIDQYVLDEVEVAPVELERSIAVLPFRNLSAVAEDAYFVDGIHDDILTKLSKLSYLEKVISRTSMERYRNTAKPMPKIGQELRVTNILEGSVQRAGDRVRIIVQLIHAASDEHVWADTYDRKLTTSNIFAIQSEIATAIAETLQATLTSDDERQLSIIPTDDLAAYDAYLLGRQAMANRTVEDLNRAEKYFEQATSLDPNFALAHVGVADSISLMVAYGGMSADARSKVIDALSKAESAAKRAMRLNPGLGEAYASLGLINRSRAEYSSGEANLKKALALAPNYAATYHWLALILQDSGRESEALDMMQRGIALDPLSRVMHVNVSGIYDALGRSDDARNSLVRALEIDPQFSRALTRFSKFHFYRGDLLEALSWYHRALERDASNVDTFADMAAAYRHLGAHEESEYWVSRVMSSNNNFEKSFVAMFRHQDQYRYEEAAESAKAILDRNSACVSCLMIAGSYLINNGRAAALIEMFQKYFPELLTSPSPDVKRWNVNLVPAAGWALQKTGETDLANGLLESGLNIARAVPRQRLSDSRGNIGSSIVDVKIYVLLGRERAALDALREAVDGGWRFWYSFHLDDPVLESLRTDPEFIALREEIEADTATQFQRLKEMERNGKLPPLPQ